MTNKPKGRPGKGDLSETQNHGSDSPPFSHPHSLTARQADFPGFCTHENADKCNVNYLRALNEQRRMFSARPAWGVAA